MTDLSRVSREADAAASARIRAAAHEQTRLAARDESTALTNKIEELRTYLATAQARVAELEEERDTLESRRAAADHARELAEERYCTRVAQDAWQSEQELRRAAESALDSARSRVKTLCREADELGHAEVDCADVLEALSTTPTPAPSAPAMCRVDVGGVPCGEQEPCAEHSSEPAAKQPCKDCDYLVDIHSPCVGCPVVAEMRRRAGVDREPVAVTEARELLEDYDGADHSEVWHARRKDWLSRYPKP